MDGAGLGDPREVDILIGGEGSDIFSLQELGQIYDSLSVIQDFNLNMDLISLPGSGRSAFVNKFVFMDGNFQGQDGAFLVRTTQGNFGSQLAFFVGHDSETLNSLFDSSSSPVF